MTRIEAIEAQVKEAADTAHVNCIHGASENMPWLIGMVKELARILQELDKENLGDYVYTLKDRELKGWDGPRVNSWNTACNDMRTVFAELQAQEPPPSTA